MTNKDIIEMYEKGLSIKFISKRYYSYIINFDMKYHSLAYNFNGKSKYDYADAVIYVQDLIIKYLSGYFEDDKPYQKDKTAKN